jgi:hypothetical protein
VPIASGLLELQEVGDLETTPANLVWLGADGTPTGVTAKGPKGSLYPFVAIAPDGTPYVSYANGYYHGEDGSVAEASPGSLTAYGPDGKPKPGWPVKFTGWPQNGSAPQPLPFGPDGTVWVLERFVGSETRVHALDPAGNERLAEPPTINVDFFTTGVVGPSGTFYVTDRTNGVTTVIAFKIDG